MRGKLTSSVPAAVDNAVVIVTREPAEGSSSLIHVLHVSFLYISREMVAGAKGTNGRSTATICALLNAVAGLGGGISLGPLAVGGGRSASSCVIVSSI